MTEETLETIILGHIAKELKDEIQIGRQVNLAKTIMQALRIHDVIGQSEQLPCPNCDGEGFSGKGTNEILPCLSCFGSGEKTD